MELYARRATLRSAVGRRTEREAACIVEGRVRDTDVLEERVYRERGGEGKKTSLELEECRRLRKLRDAYHRRFSNPYSGEAGRRWGVFPRFSLTVTESLLRRCRKRCGDQN